MPGSKCREADGAAVWIGVFGESTGGPGVSGRSNLGSGVEGESTSGDGSHFASEVTALVADATDDNGTPAIFQFKGANVVRIDSAGKGFFNGGTQTGGADVAEFIAFGGPLQPGDVAEIDTELPGCLRTVFSWGSKRVHERASGQFTIESLDDLAARFHPRTISPSSSRQHCAGEGTSLANRP